MGHVFLSYAREDRDCAERIARVIEDAGHEVWWDQHLDSGEEFAAEIEAALDKADVVLVAWSRTSVKSRWVRDEAAVGGDTGRLVPVSIDGSLAPMGFRQFHAMDLTGWKGARRDRRTAELLHAVERRLKDKPAEGLAEGPSDKAPERRRQLAWHPGKPMWAVAAVLAVLLIGAAALFLSSMGDQRRGPLPKPTIALVSFTAPSSDAQLRDLAGQARDSLSHTLSQIGMPVRLLNSVPQDRRSAGDFLLTGEVSRNADGIVATLRLDEAVHGVTVYTRRFDAGQDEIGDLPDRIGAQMADFFDGPNLLVLDRRRPIDPALMAELLADSDDPLQNYQSRKRSAAKAPNDPNAWIGLAFFTGFVLGELPRDERQSAVAMGRQATSRGLALAPEFGDTYGSWCFLHSETLLAECEDQLRAGKRVDPDAPYLNQFLADQMRNVGRFDEATDLTRLSYTHNPYDQFKIREMLHAFEFAGDGDDARDLYRQGAKWWPQFRVNFFRNRLWGLLERGDFAAMPRVEEEVGTAVLPPDYQRSGPIADALRSKSAEAVHRVCADSDALIPELRCMIAFAMMGDQDAAYAIADKLYPRRVGRTPMETERIWLDDPEGPPLNFITSPAAAPLRRDPRFLHLAERTGLLAYWRSGRLPDFCREHPEPVCRQLPKRN